MITITINSVDRTNDVEKGTVTLSQTLSKEPATLAFSLKGVKTLPALGETIVVAEDGTNIFRGTIVERHGSSVGNLMTKYNFIALDGYYQLDAKLVSKAYANTDAGTIIADIIASFVSGITLSIPASTPTIKTARFNYEQPSACIQKIANQIGWDWYIDATNVLHFFAPGDMPAPFAITDDNDTVIADSLKFDSNVTELQNIVYVRGGEYLEPISEANAVDKYSADGTQMAFPLVYKYNAAQVTVNGVAKTVGADFLGDPADYDVLYNFQEKLIRFRDDNKPTAGQIVRVFGNAYIPLIVQGIDVASATAYGEREGVKIDSTIDSIEEGELVANAILDKWREGSIEGEFVTRETGLRVGQSVSITSARFGIDHVYKINRIRGTMKQHGEFEYKVEFITSGQTTFSDILIGLIGRERNDIKISTEEVIERIQTLADTLGVSDALDAPVKTSPPYLWGSATWGFATWS